MSEPIELTSGRGAGLPALTGLTPEQAAGTACVWCAVDFTAGDVPSVPVGRSETGGQVFACADRCEVVLEVFRGFERSRGYTFPEFREHAARARDGMRRHLRETGVVAAARAGATLAELAALLDTGGAR
jgi:hypothetical protein